MPRISCWISAVTTARCWGFIRRAGRRWWGCDPSAGQFRKYYRSDIRLYRGFLFVRKICAAIWRTQGARIVTSIAMFYDLADPLSFMREVAGILADDGVWHFEQSYLPTMMKMNAYDTVCHEHLEYYALRQIEWMTKICGLRICDVTLSDANGGSFGVTVTKEKSPIATNEARVNTMFEHEKAEGLQTPAPYDAFANRVKDHREKLMGLLTDLKKRGERCSDTEHRRRATLCCEYCGVTPDDLPAIAEVENQDKFGHFTPGTNIPIISEAEAKARKPDYFLVFPWHFRDNLLKREAEWIKGGGKMILPFPQIEIYPS